MPLNLTLGVTQDPIRSPVAPACSCSYNNRVAINYDPNKRDAALAKRGLDFEDAEAVFAGSHFETEDVRSDYGEQRMICFGMLRDRMTVSGKRMEISFFGSPERGRPPLLTFPRASMSSVSSGSSSYSSGWMT